MLGQGGQVVVTIRVNVSKLMSSSLIWSRDFAALASILYAAHSSFKSESLRLRMWSPILRL